MLIASIQTERKARKEHKCDECGETIKVREIYLYGKTAGRGDDIGDENFMWSEFRFHTACIEKYAEIDYADEAYDAVYPH